MMQETSFWRRARIRPLEVFNDTKGKFVRGDFL
jgi:hypothetical protein